MNKKTGIFLNNRQKNANYDTVLSKKMHVYVAYVKKKLYLCSRKGVKT